MSERLPVRSYRRVFQIDRRVYRVDRWELPVPGGVPLAGVGYWAVAMLLTVLALALPVVGAIVGVFGTVPTIVLLPVAAAYACTRAAPDGRRTERFALGWVLFRFRHRRHKGDRRVPADGEPVELKGKVRTRWCIDSPVLRRARVHGPATVTFSEPVDMGFTRVGARSARPGTEVREYAVPVGEIVKVLP